MRPNELIHCERFPCRDVHHQGYTIPQGEARVIPAGSTYKLRDREHFFRGKRTYPSYLQVCPGFNSEKSKRRMIAEDIQRALAYLRAST